VTPVELRYVYVGTDDTASEVARWLALPGALLRWRFRHFGADGAAVDTGSPSILLIADHRPAGSVPPIFATADLDATVDGPVAGGWVLETGPLGTPEGPSSIVVTPAGNAAAVLQLERPRAMEEAFAEATNTHRVIG
jgi:hypothetical protein